LRTSYGLIVDDECVKLDSTNVKQPNMAHEGEVDSAVMDSEASFAEELRGTLWTHHVGSGIGLSDFATACPTFKAAEGASRGRLRPFPTDPPSLGKTSPR
jgi:hypothetical protein